MRDRKLVLLAVLGALAVLSLAYGLWAPSVRRPRAAIKASAPALPAGGDVSPATRASVFFEEPFLDAEHAGEFAQAIRTPRRMKRTAYETWGRNPFVLNPSGQAFAGLVLSGILWDPVRPSAIINNTVVTRGDSIGSSTVVDIHRDGVILEEASNRFELGLGE